MPGVVPQPPAVVPGEREARESGINSTKLEDAKAVLTKVKKNIRHGYPTWKVVFDGLVEPEKTAFATHTFFELVRDRHCKEKSYCEHSYSSIWEDAVHDIMEHVGMQKLIAMEWPDKRSFVQVLIDIELESALGKALRFPAALYSLHSVDKNGSTPLHGAVRRGLLQAVISILAHDDASGRLRMRRDNKKQIPMHMTGKKTTEALIRALLDRKGKEQRMSVSNGGSLPIHQAVEAAACRDIIEILLEECAAEQCLAQRAEDKCTALMLAIRSSSVYAVTALLAVNNTAAEQLGARDANGHTPIVYAQVICNQNVLSLIDSATNYLQASSSPTCSSASTAPSTPYLPVAVKVEGGDAIIEEQVEEEYSWEEDHV